MEPRAESRTRWPRAFVRGGASQAETWREGCGSRLTLRSLGQRLSAQWRLKLLLAAVLWTAFLAPYFLLQRFVLMPLRTVPVTALDHLVPFDPRWVWAYQSAYLLVGTPALLAVRRDDLLRFARGMLILSWGCFVIFFLWPVASPQPPEVPDRWAHHWGYRLLRAYDGTVNSIPSLHAGLASYSLLFGDALLRRAGRPWLLACYWSVGGTWLALILFSMLATRQHWALDLPPGLLAGWLVHRWMWRSGRSTVRGARCMM